MRKSFGPLLRPYAFISVRAQPCRIYLHVITLVVASSAQQAALRLSEPLATKALVVSSVLSLRSHGADSAVCAAGRSLTTRSPVAVAALLHGRSGGGDDFEQLEIAADSLSSCTTLYDRLTAVPTTVSATDGGGPTDGGAVNLRWMVSSAEAGGDGLSSLALLSTILDCCNT